MLWNEHMTGMTARRLAPTETVETITEIAVSGVAAVCDLTGAMYLPDHRTLVVSDLHLEKGAAFARRGQLLPPYDTLATLRLLESVVARYEPTTIVSLGDNFHDRVGSALMPTLFREMIFGLAVAATSSGSTATMIRMARHLCPECRWTSFLSPA